MNYKNRESWPIDQFPDLSQFTDPEFLEQRGGSVLLRKNSITLLTIYAVNLSFILLQGDLQPFTRLSVPWGKGNDQIFWGLLDTDSELTLIPGDLASPSFKGFWVCKLAQVWKLIEGL